MAERTDQVVEVLLRETLRAEAASLPVRVRPTDIARRAGERHRRRSYRLPGALAFVALLLLPVSLVLISGDAPPEGELLVTRARSTATALADGRVLVTGGWNADADGLASAEIYDPAGGDSRETGSMSEPRSQHTATLLDDGRVLVVGGSGADLYESARETFRRLADGIGERYGHSATKLADGRVLILGGDRADPEAAPVATIFDPGTETFAERLPADEELLDRMWHTVLPLDDLRVLVVGGAGAQQHYRRGPAVIYDLATDKVLTLPFSPPTWASGIDPRAAVTAAPLPDGRVLMVVMPDDGPPEGVVLFVFDPASEAFERVAEIPSGFDKFPVPVPVTLADGQVLMVFHGDVSGGDTYLYEVYRFDPLEERMTLVTSFEDAWDPTLVALPDGGAVSIRGGSSRSEVNRLVRDSVPASPAASRSPGRG